MKIIDQVPRFTLTMRILVMTPLMVMSPSSAKPILVLSFDGLRTFTCGNWGIDFPHTLLEVCPAHKTRERSNAGALLVGKHQQNQNFIYSPLTLGTSNKIKLMLCALFIYIMGDKIRRLSMNVAFKYIWQKRLSCLTYGRIIYLS